MNLKVVDWRKLTNLPNINLFTKNEFLLNKSTMNEFVIEIIKIDMTENFLDEFTGEDMRY